MKTCVLDGNLIQNKETLHEILAEHLALPKWYGKNLDALYDCLTDLSEDTEIEIVHETVLIEHLGGYSKGFFRMLQDAADENEHIKLRMEK